MNPTTDVGKSAPPVLGCPSRMLAGSGSRREASGGQRDLVAWESLLEPLRR